MYEVAAAFSKLFCLSTFTKEIPRIMAFLQITFASLLLGMLQQSSLSLMQGCPPESAIQPCVCMKEMVYFKKLLCKGIVDETGEKLRKVISVISEYDVKTFHLKDSVLGTVPDGLLEGSIFKEVVLVNVKFDTFDPFAFVSGTKHRLYGLLLENVFANNWQFSTNAHDFWNLNYLGIINHERNTSSPTLPEDFLSLLPETVERIEFENVGGGVIADPGLSKFPEIEQVTFAGHGLQEIRRNIFPKRATQLQYLNLKNNSLTTLPENFFEDMPALDEIDLESNQFTHFDENVFFPIWGHLYYLNLQGNPLHCGCEAAWLMRKKPGPAILELPRCASPPHHKDRPLSSIPISELC